MPDRDESVFGGKVRVRCELVEWVYPPIADGESLQVEVMVRVVVDKVSNRWNIVSSEALARDV